MTLEDDLRTTLLDRAATPAPAPDLWASVTAGVQRDRRRRRTVVAVAAAAVVAAGAAVPALLHDRQRAAPSTPAASVAPTPAAPPVIFPLRPTWTPSWLDTGSFTVTRMGPNVRMDFTRDIMLSTEIGPLRGDWEVEATDVDQVDIHGQTAELRSAGTYDGAGPGDRFTGVRWRLPDGRWITVLSMGRMTRDELLQYARGLAGGRRPALLGAPFTLPFVPSGLVVQFEAEDALCFASPRVAATERQPSGLCLTVDTDRWDHADAGETWDIGGRQVAYYPEAASLSVQWGGDTAIDVTWDPEEIPLTHEQVVQLAAGLRYVHR
ncbi:hypothetical protein BJY16_006118 [Actinoplanes octamycinicus]|uniref:DUF4367 domain-containing protein n=1 Tax=Actinoplanes octamycinicus TaxID=135948 RepID=A0A7W7H2B4_9ACTN|nr:hypothetical protein [Actinoplanes octamycinicus]MBB4742659.1 hypothetical protein [Actinoplanes octamycinicus]GIE60997.1 hypothetical protein Aoc01nite_63990 [Actinoplanes octamycinicus]